MHLPRYDGLRDILAFDNWPALLFVRLFDRKTGFVAYRKNGFDILVDYRGGDENGTRSCIAHDMYRRYLPFLILPKPARVLDIGGNGGGFPLMLKIAGIDLARVVSVEMNPLTYLRLQINLATNLGSTAIPINAAVCGMQPDSEILLKPSRGSTGESMYDDQVNAGIRAVPVKTTTLEALYGNYFKNELVDICKIDIEGAEYELFASAPDDVLRKIRYLIIEFHDASKTPALLERIEALGFVDMTISKKLEAGARTVVRAFRGPEA